MNPPLLRIGSAAGFSGDRTDAAVPVVAALAAAGGPAFLIFETLAERTLALAQLARRQDPASGYEPLLDAMLRPVLADCLRAGIRIVGNFGAANPPAAARHIQAMARELGMPPPRVAVVDGDDVGTSAHRAALTAALGAAAPAAPLVSANAYLGAGAIAAALRAGADIVVAGRVADPSLTVGPAMAHYGWAEDDWDRLARATMAGHLLECGAQVTGGYFADPGYKDVPDLAHVGYPIAEIDADGHCVVGKPPGTGGRVDACTVKEQLLYEVHDPAAYVTPDVVADLGAAQVEEIGRDRVRLSGVRGHPRPAHLKVNACFENGWLAEGEISYAGPRAEARARLAAEVLRTRLAGLGRVRADLIGVASIFGDDDGTWLAGHAAGEARDVRLRVALNHARRDMAERLTREVTALYTCGPAGGGGVRVSLRPRLGLVSCLMPRDAVRASFTMLADDAALPAGAGAAPALLRAGQETMPTAAAGTPAAGTPIPAAEGAARSVVHGADGAAASLGEDGEARAQTPPGRDGRLRVPLYRLAHGRTGDKGDRSNISLIAWHPALWPVLVEQVTEAAVAARFAHRGPSRVRRHLLPALHAMNLVLDDVLDGGVNDALNLDTHGKALAFWLLDHEIELPAGLARHLAGQPAS